jgi:diguanylate cyclase (GGDEF)-like protein
MLDLDNFKHINDTFGHQAGDLVLRETSLLLRGCVRSSDIIARYGGEEIIVLLRGALLKDAVVVAEKMRKAIEGHLFRDGSVSVAVTASLGLTFFDHEDSSDSLIKRADQALYKAKTSGKNRVCTLDMTA